jgi:flagellar hook-length control protein FliK
VPASQSPALDAAPVPAAAPSGRAGEVAAAVQAAVASSGDAGETRAAPAPAPAPATKPADAPTPAASQADVPPPAAPPAAPSPASATLNPAATPAPRLPVHPDQARALLQIANHRGVAQARLSLHPAELGGVEVRLRVTTHGLVASITADRPDSAQVLQQAGADLKRALEAQGIEVAGIDIGVAGDDARQRAHQRDADAPGTHATRAAGDDEELSPIDTDHPTTTATTIALGALVDVLA